VKEVPVVLHMVINPKNKRQKEWVTSHDSEIRFGLEEVDSWSYIEPPAWLRRKWIKPE